MRMTLPAPTARRPYGSVLGPSSLRAYYTAKSNAVHTVCTWKSFDFALCAMPGTDGQRGTSSEWLGEYIQIGEKRYESAAMGLRACSAISGTDAAYQVPKCNVQLSEHHSTTPGQSSMRLFV
eukprot:3705290-Rhodomonas_salina.1